MACLQLKYLALSLFLLLTQVEHCFAYDSATCQPTNYSVSPTGSDSASCVSEKSTLRRPCRTLVYLLHSIQNRSCVSISVLYNQNFSNTTAIIHSVQNWRIEGYRSAPGPIHISCSGKSGIVFENSSNILLGNLLFMGCNATNNFTVADESYPLVEVSALYFFQCCHVEVSNCSFLNGSGTGIILNDVSGNISIRGTNFTGNRPINVNLTNNLTSGGLIVRTKQHHCDSYSSFTIDNCNFVRNMNSECHFNHEDYVGVGGGVTFNLSTSANIFVISSRFSNNHACEGGGLHVYQRGIKSNVSVSVIDSHFEHGHTYHEGGGIWIQQRKSERSTLNLIIQNSTFLNNSGEFGGGLGIYNGNAEGKISMMATNSVWSQNNALNSGFAVGFSALAVTAELPASTSSVFHVETHFQNCSFVLNSNYGFYKTLSAVGAVELRGTTAIFNNTSFINNSGTALHLRYFSYAEFVGNNSFVNNTGNKGGALSLDHQCFLGLKEGSSLHFCNNHAVVYGGALYVDNSKQDDGECIFKSLRSLLNISDSEAPLFLSENGNESLSISSGGIINVVFDNNTVGALKIGGADQSIFIDDLDGCLKKKNRSNLSMNDVLLFDRKIFTYNPHSKTQVASFPESIKISSESFIEVMPGEFFHLKPTATDLLGNDGHLYGHLTLALHKKNKSATYTNLELIGPNFISMDGFTQNIQLHIKADRSMIDRHDYNLFLQVNDALQSDQKTTKEIEIRLIDCKVGFKFNNTEQVCKCNTVSDHMVCNLHNSYACVKYGYWHSNDATLNHSIPCPGQNCDYRNGHCPSNSKSCNNTPGYCLLRTNDSLCWNGRSGLLCSKCNSSSSFTFAGTKCVPNTTCKLPHTALIIFGLIAYWIFLVIFILFILRVNLSTGTGVAYGIMYFFSVAVIVTENTVTDSILHTAIGTSVAVTQLYPQAIGMIPICFVEKWTCNLQHLIFHYVTPVAVIFLILIVILSARIGWCPKSISPAQNSPIHAICILILASYTSLTYTSFEILRPIEIGGEWRVYVDPEIKYFDLPHLPYAVIALSLELFVSLPICFAVLFAPYLSGKVNMVKLKLKQILDEFQACYRPECRWFAGFYFLARQLIFLVNAIPSTSLPEDNTYLQTLNAAIFIAYCAFQPYKLKWLNILDTILLADITFLSFFRLEFSTSITQRIIAYFLILVPSLCLALLMVLVIIRRLSFCFKIRREKTKEPLSDVSTRNSVRKPPLHWPTHTSVKVNQSRDISEYEPLLTSSTRLTSLTA